MADARIDELYNDLQTQVIQCLGEAGIDPALARLISVRVRHHMATHWAGQQIYFPKDLSSELEPRNQQIWSDFNGKNYNELSRKYGLTTQQIYKIINACREKYVEEHQPKLF